VYCRKSPPARLVVIVSFSDEHADLGGRTTVVLTRTPHNATAAERRLSSPPVRREPPEHGARLGRPDGRFEACLATLGVDGARQRDPGTRRRSGADSVVQFLRRSR
jgi:hypothetical protein